MPQSAADLAALAKALGGAATPVQTTPKPDLAALAKSLGGQSQSLEDRIRDEATKVGLDPEIALAVARKESSLNPNAVGQPTKTGERAVGLFQMMSGAAKDTGTANTSDPFQNIAGGVKYLKQLHDQFGGDTRKALVAYNGGRGNVAAGTTSPEAEAYADAVLASVGKPAAGPVKTQATTPLKPVSSHPASGYLTQKSSQYGEDFQQPANPKPASKPGLTEMALEAVGDAGKSMAQSMDPRTTEGQVNDAATLAAGAATWYLGGAGAPITATTLAARTAGMSLMRSRLIGAFVQKGVAPWIARVLTPAVAAGTAATATNLAQQSAGKVDSEGAPVSTALKEGAWQGGLEFLGGGTIWGLTRYGSRPYLGQRVLKQAREHLSNLAATVARYGRTAIEGATDTARAARDAVADQGLQSVRAAKDRAETMVGQARQTADQVVGGVREQGATRVRTAQEAAIQGEREAESTGAVRLSQVAADTTEGVRSAKDIALRGVRTARKQSAEAVAQAELEAADQVTKTTRDYEALSAPSTTEAGRLATAVVRGAPGVLGPPGPATIAFNAAGKRVRETAMQGPPIAMGPIKAEMNKMGGEAFPTELGFPTKGGEAATTPARPRMQGGEGLNPAEIEKYNRRVDAYEQSMAMATPDKPPSLPGLLALIQEAPDVVSFASLDKLKNLLDSVVNWDAAAKAPRERITKGIRNVIREAMDYEPYNQATELYGKLAKLHREGIGAKLMAAAHENPDGVVKLLQDGSPEAARGLKSLLVDQSAEGGNAELGQQAWQAVRERWAYDKLVKPGVEGLSDRVAALVKDNGEFASIVFGDEAGQKYLTHLDQIGKAYQGVVEEGAQKVAATKTAGREAVGEAIARGQAGKQEARDVAQAATQQEKDAVAQALNAARARGQVSVQQAKDIARQTLEAHRAAAADVVAAAEKAGQQHVQSATDAARIASRDAARTGAADVRATQRAVRQSKEGVQAQRVKLEDSSLSQGSGSQEKVMEGADVARVFLVPKSGAGILSAARLILRSHPKVSDIVDWAASSDARTKQLISLLLNPMNPRATAAFFRAATEAIGVGGPSHQAPQKPVASHAQPVSASK